MGYLLFTFQSAMVDTAKKRTRIKLRNPPETTTHIPPEKAPVIMLFNKKGTNGKKGKIHLG